MIGNKRGTEAAGRGSWKLGAGCGDKFEVRNSKFESMTNDQVPMTKQSELFGYWGLEFDSSFEFRHSNLSLDPATTFQLPRR